MCNGNTAAPNYNLEENKCKCGESEACPDSNSFCVDGTCLCSKTTLVYTKGDLTTQGSCKESNQACSPDGTCISINLMIRVQHRF